MWLSFPLLSLAYAREVVSNGIARLPRLHVLAALGRHARSPLLLLLTLGLACACAAKPPRLQPHAVIVSQVTPQSIQLTLDLEVFNDNSFPLIAQRVEGELRVKDNLLGRGSARPEGTVPANSSKRLSAQLDVPWDNVAALAPFALSAQPVPYLFVGKAIIGGQDVHFDLPFEIHGQLTGAKLLQAGLKGL